jgi:hypothetical protein
MSVPIVISPARRKMRSGPSSIPCWTSELTLSGPLAPFRSICRPCAKANKVWSRALAITQEPCYGGERARCGSSGGGRLSDTSGARIQVFCPSGCSFVRGRSPNRTSSIRQSGDGAPQLFSSNPRTSPRQKGNGSERCVGVVEQLRSDKT